jgi:2,4-dienoyl-CoA reductase (NADPH2)
LADLATLFTPIRIGRMEIPNRIVMAPMTVDYGSPDETPSERQIAYYQERARGGVGLIGLEVCTVDGEHKYQQHSLGLHHDDLIEGHKKLVDAIHAEGVKVQPQLTHAGPESLAPFFKQLQPMGPSVIRTETTKQACREITLEEIEQAIENYGDAAVRAREAGYDGIELHAAHNYMLLGSFLSPLRNFRTDEYAGHSFEGRAKLLLQVLAKIRERAGEDLPITVRLSGFERVPGGREINDTQRLAPLLVNAGVDCFHVSGGVGDGNITQIITGPEYQPGYNVAAAAALKQVVDVPVMVVGQNWDPHHAAEIIENGEADLIAMARGLLADPQLPTKALEGRLAEITPCIVCQDCVDRMTSEMNGTGCAVNPRCGAEAEFSHEPAAKAKKVVVVGGGPGGLVAATTAAERGHDVTLIERDATLGGAYRLASTAFPYNQRFLDHLLAEVDRLGVDVRLGQEATSELVQTLGPDAILVATGGRFESPGFVGDDGGHVIKGAGVLELVEKARSGAALPAGDTVAVIGGNLIALELAEHFALAGRRVRVLEPGRRLAMPAGKKRRGDHAKRLDTLGVPVNTGIAIQGIAPDGVSVARPGGDEHLVRADLVLVIGEPAPDASMLERFESVASEVHAIGDATGFGLSKKAVNEGFRAAYAL